MKKLSAAALALSLGMLCVPVWVQAKAYQETTQDDQKAPLKDIKGTVKSTNGTITFVADEGGKSWEVVNPETLKDHIGHHVQVNAHVYVDKGQIHVMSVTML